MFNIDCHALSFNVWPRPPFIRMKNFDPISSGPVFKYLKGVKFLGLKFRGFFLFHNKIHVNAKIKSRDFFRITATSKFKPSEILNFYQPQFSILVNHWVKILYARKIFGVWSDIVRKHMGRRSMKWLWNPVMSLLCI